MHKIRNESLFRAVFEHSMDAILITAPDSRIFCANRAACKMFGMAEKEIITRGRSGLVDPSDDRIPGLLKKRSRSGKASGEFRMLRKNGSVFTAEVSSAIFLNNENEKRTIMIIRDCTQRVEAEIALERKETGLIKTAGELRALTAHLENAREKERNEIALNLHDDLGQKLTALNLDISWLRGRIGVQSPVVRCKIDEMSHLITEIIDGIKETSLSLYPSILFDLGLIPAIRWQLDKFSAKSGIKYSFSTKQEKYRISKKISLILYRILQESLTNIMKHSGATQTMVTLRYIKSELEFKISDNGRGILVEEINSLKSTGLTGIRERIRSVNGKFEIISGNGTTLKITLNRESLNEAG